MAKLSTLSIVLLTLGCVWSQYYRSHPQPFSPSKIVFRHHFPSYHSGPFMPAVPFPQPFHPISSPSSPLLKIPPSYANPSPRQPISNHIPYNPPSYYNHAPPQPGMHSRYPYSSPHHSQAPYSASPISGYPKPSFFSKIKPYIFGPTSPKTLPHHPFYPNHHHPHNYSPNKGFYNQNSNPHHGQQHQLHHHDMHQIHHMHQQHSCSCSLHVGHLTVYKHTDMRASYSCHDLKDCKAFCTNLFSSEDLRAQTRSDACLMIGKDVTVPWFRRDQACDHGVHNDTKLSVDLCCKDLQPC